MLFPKPLPFVSSSLEAVLIHHHIVFPLITNHPKYVIVNLVIWLQAIYRCLLLPVWGSKVSRGGGGGQKVHSVRTGYASKSLASRQRDNVIWASLTRKNTTHFKVSVSKWSSQYEYWHNGITNSAVTWKLGHAVAAVMSRAQLYIKYIQYSL